MKHIKGGQLDKLIQEIEGRLNDFEGGISDKEETIKSFAEFIGKISANVAQGEIKKIIKYWRSELSSELYIALKTRLDQIEEAL